MNKIFFTALILFFNTQPLTLDRVILATNDNENYIDFWPIAAKAWKKIVGVKPTLALIADDDVQVDESLGDVIRFKPIPGVPTSLYAQTIRLLLPAYFENEVCIVSDIDLIPLSKDYYADSIVKLPDDFFAVYRNCEYTDTLNLVPNQYPMSYVAAKGKTFKDVFKINNIDEIPAIVQSWANLDHGWSTDEIMLFKYLNEWQDFKTRCKLLNHIVEGRIDKIWWTYKINEVKQKKYIDSTPPRPYKDHKDAIDFLCNLLYKEDPRLKNRALSDAKFGTHMTPLITAISNTSGPILELGSGDYSTPLIHAICAKEKRYILTTDTDRKWLNLFLDLQSDWHQFIHVPVYEDDFSVNPKPNVWDNIGNGKHWSVVFVDHRPADRRIVDIMRLRDKADIFVVHDTENPGYGYSPQIDTFKYKYVYDRYETQTTIVSDTIDIEELFKEL